MSRAPQNEEAIVLRSLKLGDTSKIVTALTPRYGRIKVVAKGARRIGSRLGSLLEPGNEVELLVYVREGRDLWTLGDATLRRAVLTGGTSLDKLSHLLAALELCDRLVPEQQPLPELEVLVRTWLDRWHEATDETMAALFFAIELSLLSCLGVELGVHACGTCQALLGQEQRAQYRVHDGILVCAQCAKGGAGRWLDTSMLSLLADLDAVLPQGAAPPLTPSERSSVGRLLHEHMTFHLQGYRLPRALFWLAKDSGPKEHDRT